VNCTTPYFEDLPLTPPDTEEIIKVLSKMKNNKSPGFDGMNYLNMVVNLVAWLQIIFEKIWIDS